MNLKTYIDLRNEIFIEANAIAKSKNKDYQNDDNPLKFIQEQSIKSSTDEYVTLSIYMDKPIESILNYLKNKGEVKLSEPLESRIVDTINYLMMLNFLVNEETDYMKMRNRLFERANKLVSTKGVEYTQGNEDVAHYIKDKAKRRKVSEYVILSIFINKHLTSIEYVIDNKGAVTESESLEERIVDVINYLLFILTIK